MINKNKYKWVGKENKLEHRKVMEERLGRVLVPTEFVHHINGDKSDNRIENLMLTNRSEHSSEHMKQIWKGKLRKVIKSKYCEKCGKEIKYTPKVGLKQFNKTRFCSVKCNITYAQKVYQDKHKKKCSKCYGFGIWATGDPSPMGPMDYSDGCPNKKCPKCGSGGNK